MQRAKSETQLNDVSRGREARSKGRHANLEADVSFMTTMWNMLDIHHIRDSVLGVVYMGTIRDTSRDELKDASESDSAKRKRVVAKRSYILTAEQRHCRTFDDPERDAKVLIQLNAKNENKGHSHIIRLVDFVVEKERSLLWTVTEYGGKDMYEVIISLRHTPSQTLTESDSKSIARQLGKTLLQMHKWGIAHLDIGCENILLEPLDDKKTTSWHARFCDFGMAYQCDIDKNGVAQWQNVYDRFGGKFTCMSPEQVIHAKLHVAHTNRKKTKKLKKHNAAKAAASDSSVEEYKKQKQESDKKHLAELKATGYDARAADVFAWGSIVFQMVCGCPPFEIACPDTSPDYRVILNGKLSWVIKSWKCQYLSSECIDFLQQILTAPLEKRIDIASWLAHPWFQQ